MQKNVWPVLFRQKGNSFHFRLAVNQIMPYIFILLGTFGFFFSTPRSAGADEPIQQATAWHALTNPLGVSQPMVVGGIPKALVDGSPGGHPCFAANSQKSASCQVDRSWEGIQGVEYIVVNYPTPYYLVVGLGQKIFSLVSWNYIDLGGRLASIVLNLLLVILIIKRSRIFLKNPEYFLLSLMTPMAFFYLSVVNPSGWELLTSIFFSVNLIVYQNYTSATSSNIDKKFLIFSSLAFCLSRPASFFWAIVIIFLYFVLNSRSTDLRQCKKVLLYSTPGILTGILWNVFHRPSSGGNSKVEDPSLSLYFDWFLESIKLVSLRIQQMYGNLGWLDTPIPKLFVVITSIVWIILLFKGSSFSERIKVFVVLCFSVVVLPSAVETTNWNNWPGWWQGRYTMPLAASTVILIWIKKSTSMGKIFPVALLFLNCSAVTYMIVKNLFRYATGNQDFSFVWNSTMGIGEIRFYLSLLCAVILTLTIPKLLINYSKSLTPSLRG